MGRIKHERIFQVRAGNRCLASSFVLKHKQDREIFRKNMQPFSRLRIIIQLWGHMFFYASIHTI